MLKGILFGTIFLVSNVFGSSELAKRLELYGLNAPKNPLIQENITPLSDEVKRDQEHDIIKNFIPFLEEKLGRCNDVNCLLQKDGYKILKTSFTNICLPYTQCEFYKCMEEKYQCEPEGIDYFTKLAFPTCSTYKKNIEKSMFTQKGYNWIYTVMVCLQKGLIDECEVKGNCQRETRKKTCDYITDFTLKFHPGCYLNSGVGVCKLPLKDKINIWRTVGKYLTPRERQEAIKVVKTCIKQGF